MRFLLVLLLCSLPSISHAQFRVNESAKSHNVNQNNPYKLFQTIKKTIARYCDGVSSHSVACAVSKTDVQWKVVETSPEKCNIEDVALTLSVTYHIPKWQNYSRQIQDVKVQWRELKKEIVKHEEHHGAISKKHMQRAYNEISQLKGSCRRLTDKANSVFENHIQKAKQEHRSFDARDGRNSITFPD